MAAYGYCRVSTDRQAEEGESLDVQRRKLEGYAMQQGWRLDRIFVERGISGSRVIDQRPEGQKLIAALCPGDIVVTSKLDRMFRSALDALQVLDDLRRRGIALHMIDLGGDVTGNGISKLVFTILSAVAEAERDRIRERVREVKADQRQRQRYLGGTVPFGWRLGEDGCLSAHPEQQETIARILHLGREGKSTRAIARELGIDRIILSHVTIAAVLRRCH